MDVKITAFTKKVLPILCIGAICLLGLKLAISIVVLATEGMNMDIMADVLRDVFAMIVLYYIKIVLCKKKK